MALAAGSSFLSVVEHNYNQSHDGAQQVAVVKLVGVGSDCFAWLAFPRRQKSRQYRLFLIKYFDNEKVRSVEELFISLFEMTFIIESEGIGNRVRTFVRGHTTSFSIAVGMVQ